MLKFMMLGVLLLVAAGCTQVKAGKSLTAKDVFDKTVEAASELKDVQAHFAIENLSAPVDPEQKKTTKYDIQSIYTSEPAILHQTARVSQTGAEPWDVELYRINDRLFGKDGEESGWGEVPFLFTETFGPIYQYINPTMDLSLFENFKEEFELEPVDYGYSLTLNMTKEQFEQFSQQLGPEYGGAFQDDKAFLLVERLDFEIVVDRSTFFVTDFKMLTDTTTYVGRDSHRTRQKVNATYSYFNDVDAIQVPEKIRNLAK
ncbi:DUF6612 family protein [Bacillus sp. OxB-1]|uniref:DUF6612 family protein n=1 Tax=Bacillus sp. (strain OxB-1) TaxID=98228 RepID=UPI002F90D6FB